MPSFQASQSRYNDGRVAPPIVPPAADCDVRGVRHGDVHARRRRAQHRITPGPVSSYRRGVHDQRDTPTRPTVHYSNPSNPASRTRNTNVYTGV